MTDKKNFSNSKKEQISSSINNPKNAQFKIILIIGMIAIVISIFAFLVSYRHFSSKKVATNSININIEKLIEESNLEVLSISDSEIIIENADDNKDGIIAWNQYTGTGIFTINLAASEFIIDKIRKIVIIKTPNVEMNNFTLEYGKTKQMFFKNNLFNDDYQDGANLAQKQLYKAYGKIHDTIITNPYYYLTAKKSAQKIIESLVKGLNKDVLNLQVYVEIGAI